MDTQEDKDQLKALENEIKMAFKDQNHEALKAIAEKIKAIDPENRLVQKLMKKEEKMKQKEEAKVKKAKVKEYEGMLKKLLKDQESEKLTALVKEFKDLDPDSSSAEKWTKKANKLDEKLHGKNETEADKKDIPLDEKSRTGKAIEDSSDSKGKKKPGFFASLFKKSKKEEEKPLFSKTEEVKPTPETPMATKPMEAGPVVPATVAAPKPMESSEPLAAKMPVTSAKPQEKAPDKPKEEKGNLFTKMFGKKEEETQKKSIIDTIVATTDKKEEKKIPEKKMEVQKTKQKDGAGLLSFSKVFINFTAVFIVLSASFLYVEWLDKGNTVLNLVGISDNTGSKLHNASEEVGDLKRQEAILNKNIELFKGGYDDKALKTVQSIIEERINWPGIFAKINEVTNSVYELNDFFKYIEYNNYSFDAENGTIRVTGTLSDPLGRNLTKLVELEEAFKFYPQEKNNPDDPIKPYFTGFREFNSFSKTLDITTGRYNSSFQLSFTLNE